MVEVSEKRNWDNLICCWDLGEVYSMAPVVYRGAHDDALGGGGMKLLGGCFGV